jgi:hypothetical protein
VSGPWTSDSSTITSDSEYFASGSGPPAPAPGAWSADSSVVTADSGIFTADGSSVSLAQFPNVPALPGVPALARRQTAAVVAAAATTTGETQAIALQLGLPTSIVLGSNAFYSGLALSPLAAGSSPQSPSASQALNANSSVPSAALPLYAISAGSTALNQVNLIIQPDSAVEFEIQANSNVNSHPVEQGGFQSYNRVQDPISIRLLLACQGKNMPRATFLSTLATLREGTQIVTVSTPDASYPNMVLKGYGYKKEAARGAVTIWADTTWVEERSTNVVVSSPPTSQPQGAATSNLGTLQEITPTAQQLGSISNPPYIPAPLPLQYPTAPPSGDAW